MGHQLNVPYENMLEVTISKIRGDFNRNNQMKRLENRLIVAVTECR